MTAHLRSCDGHNLNLVNEGSGRRPYRLHVGSDARGMLSCDRRHSRSPTGSRRYPRPIRSTTRGRAERRRRTTPGESSSSSPDPRPERRLIDFRQSIPNSTVNCIPTPLSDDVVIGIGMPSVSSPVPEGVKLVTVKELAMKIIPLINTLKAQVANLQLTLSVLPNVEQVVKELKASYLLLEQKCGCCVVHQGKTDAALKLLNQSSLAYDFSKLPRDVGMPLSVQGMPTMVGILSNEVMAGPALRGPKTVVSPPLVDLSMLDFDNLFQ